MSIKKKLVSIVLSGALTLGIAGKAKADWSNFEVTEPSIPIPGYSPNPSPTIDGPHYIRPDGKFMTVGVGGPSSSHDLSTRTLDTETGIWEDPISLGITADNQGSYLSPDENMLFFVRNREIHRAKKIDGVWSNIESLGISGAFPSFNGKQLYFHQLFGSGTHPHDILVADYDFNTDTFNNIRLIDSINTSYQEHDPWISKDGKLITFSSDRPGGYGDWDIWYATREDTSGDNWTNITNAGPYLNSGVVDAAGRIAEDAKLMFFAKYWPITDDAWRMQAPIVPEPASLGLLGAGGLVGLLAGSKRRK